MTGVRGVGAALVVVLSGCPGEGEGEVGSGTSATSSPTSTTASTSTTVDPDTSTSASGDSSTTGPLDCTLPEPPLDYELFTDVFSQSEDIVFDGNGNMLGKQGDDILMVDAAGQTSVFAAAASPSYGLRMLQGGDVVFALQNPGARDAGVVARVSAGGAPTELATGLTLPNGVFVDLEDRVWFTDPGQAAILRIETDGSLSQVLSGASASGGGGLVYDDQRSLLWYSYYDAGQIRRAPIDAMGNAGELEILLTIDGWIQGLVLDQCGHLYIVDHRDNELLRLELDPSGDPVGEPEVLAQLPTFVYSAQFGKGDGFPATTLYLVGGPGSVYGVDVGIPGAPVPPL